MAKDERRINMYFSENKFIDETIYQYLESVPNKQDKIKMILYSYITGQGIVANDFVTKSTPINTKTTQKSEDKVTKTERKKHKKALNSEEMITKKSQEKTKKETEITQISDNKKEQQASKTNIDEKKAKLLNGLNYFNKK